VSGGCPDGRAARLRALAQRDRATRARLVADGVLFDGYHPEMERVHLENARAMEELLDAGGWPEAGEVGEAAAEAALLVALHAISAPAFQRRCCRLLRAAVERGAAPARQLARLEDRVAFNERKPQRYGTVFDWDAAGRLSPWTLEDPTAVEALRQSVGLPALAEEVARLRRAAGEEGNRPPGDHRARQAEMDAWARRVGWIE
jgi:hypothetical protein